MFSSTLSRPLICITFNLGLPGCTLSVFRSCVASWRSSVVLSLLEPPLLPLLPPPLLSVVVDVEEVTSGAVAVASPSPELCAVISLMLGPGPFSAAAPAFPPTAFGVEVEVEKAPLPPPAPPLPPLSQQAHFVASPPDRSRHSDLQWSLPPHSQHREALSVMPSQLWDHLQAFRALQPLSLMKYLHGLSTSDEVCLGPSVIVDLGSVLGSP